MKKISVIAILLFLLFQSCSSSEKTGIIPLKQITVTFSHMQSGMPLVNDTLIYVNGAGQKYMVNDLQYFISSLRLRSCTDGWISISTDGGIHYTDIDIAGTDKWVIAESLPDGCYDSVSFIFGFDDASNISNRFPDPPQRDMFWPDVLGGGYHYMKMNLKWKNDTMSQLSPFMCHLGRGQMYDGPGTDPSNIIGFIDNSFKVTLPCDFTLSSGSSDINLKMNIGSWFTGNNVFDFSDYPMGIMQNQQGMFRIVQNGKNVFSL